MPMKEYVMERVEAYLLTNAKEQFLSDKFTWTEFNRRTKQFDTLEECMEIKSQRPSAKVVEIVHRYTSTINYGLTKMERIERLIEIE